MGIISMTVDGQVDEEALITAVVGGGKKSSVRADQL